MDNTIIENIEIELLLEAVFLRYGYDFRNYAKATIKRRVENFMKEHLPGKHISALIQEVLYNQQLYQQLMYNFSITVTEMFRDPEFYLSLRKNVIPYLKTYPYIKIWHAGCATGEEVYSLAILLKEENLYERATIFATDYNDIALQKAKSGIYELDNIKTFTSNYQKAGGKNSFSQYYYAEYDSVIIDKTLKERITFANHNLVTDSVFSEVHMIFCRNVLIYFDPKLQQRVLNLFFQSLIHNGFLCLGTKESLQFSDAKENFGIIDKTNKIFRKYYAY